MGRVGEAFVSGGTLSGADGGLRFALPRRTFTVRAVFQPLDDTCG